MSQGHPLPPNFSCKQVGETIDVVPAKPVTRVTRTFEERGYYGAVLYRGQHLRRLAGYIAGYGNQCIADAKAFVARYGIGQDEPLQVIVIEHIHHFDRTVVGQREKANFSRAKANELPELEDLYGAEHNRRLVSFNTVWSTHTSGQPITAEQAVAIIRDYA